MMDLILKIISFIWSMYGLDEYFNLETPIPESITENVYFIYVYGPNANDHVRLKLTDGLTINNYPDFNPNSTTLFYFPGWGADYSSIQLNGDELISGYLQNSFGNLVVVDYSRLVKSLPLTLYIEASYNSTLIGKAIGQYFKQYIPQVQPAEHIRLAGFSLGCEIISKAARIYALSNQVKLKWITALEPAGPLFDLPGIKHLTIDDAEFVDVVYTDRGVQSDYRISGHVNFFPNGGRRMQPGCLFEAIDCSHQLAWKLFSESLVDPEAFPARRCRMTEICCLDLKLCECDDVTNYMGINVNKTKHGTFFLKTNAESPYAQGEEGIIF